MAKPKIGELQLKTSLTLEDLKEKAEQLVLEAALDSIPGEEKARKVARQLVKYYDDQVDYGGGPVGVLIDKFDKPVLNFLLMLVVKQAYQFMKEKDYIR